MFVSTGGTAGLILREIPSRGVAYVRLGTVEDLEALVSECADFCRQCGAETILASRGSEALAGLSPAYDLLALHVKKDDLPPAGAQVDLLPMTPENDAIYQRLYNRCFAAVPGAATYDRAAIQRIYEARQTAFIALSPAGEPAGMGELHGNELAAIGLLEEYRGTGMGKNLALSLLRHCPGPEITLTAASTNLPALRLYDALGFTVCGLVSRWYRIG